MSMYNVIFVDQWASAIPNTWVDENDGTCKWPPKNINATHAIKKLMTPMENWKLLRFKKVLGPYDSYEIARAVEISAVDLSTSDEIGRYNIETEVLEKTRKKCALKKNMTYNDECDDDNISTSSSSDSPPKKRSKSAKCSNERSHKSTSINDATSVECPQIEAINSELYKTKTADPQPQDVQRELFALSSSSNTSHKLTSGHENCCKACRQEQREILHMVRELYASHMENDNGFTSRQLQSEKEECALPFPLKSTDEFDGFEKMLADAGTQRQMKRLVLQIGGATGEKHIRNTLTRVLDNSLAYRLSWTGQKKTKGINETKFVDVLIGATLQAHKDVTIASMQKVIKDWLQHAGDRIRYSLDKKKA